MEFAPRRLRPATRLDLQALDRCGSDVPADCRRRFGYRVSHVRNSDRRDYMGKLIIGFTRIAASCGHELTHAGCWLGM